MTVGSKRGKIQKSCPQFISKKQKGEVEINFIDCEIPEKKKDAKKIAPMKEISEKRVNFYRKKFTKLLYVILCVIA